jgi:hypothetical protein
MYALAAATSSASAPPVQSSHVRHVERVAMAAYSSTTAIQGSNALTARGDERMQRPTSSNLSADDEEVTCRVHRTTICP